MTKSQRIIINGLIDSRIDVAMKRLDENPEYQEQCRQQDESEEVAEELLHKLDKDERLTIRRHYEGETAKAAREQDEAYIQGLRDCIKALAFLGAFNAEAAL